MKQQRAALIAAQGSSLLSTLPAADLCFAASTLAEFGVFPKILLGTCSFRPQLICKSGLCELCVWMCEYFIRGVSLHICSSMCVRATPAASIAESIQMSGIEFLFSLLMINLQRSPAELLTAAFVTSRKLAKPPGSSGPPTPIRGTFETNRHPRWQRCSQPASCHISMTLQKMLKSRGNIFHFVHLLSCQVCRRSISHRALNHVSASITRLKGFWIRSCKLLAAGSHVWVLPRLLVWVDFSSYERRRLFNTLMSSIIHAAYGNRCSWTFLI